MKKNLFQIFFLLAYITSSAKSNPVTDTTLPTCAKTLMVNNKLDITEYNYKGQRWFTMQKKTVESKNNSDKMTTTIFYNDSCKIVCNWKRGGIAGLNKVFPDTIQKEKILIVKMISVDSTVSNKKSMSLPDSIAKLAILRNSKWIEENLCNGKLVYRFQNPTDNPSTSKITFAGFYYNENGKAMPSGNIEGKTWWWHNVNGKFLKTQFRPGYR